MAIDKRIVAVLGAGSGGKAIAAKLAYEGHEVRLFSRSEARIASIIEAGGITLSGSLNLFARPAQITTSLADAVEGAEVLLVTTTADAHAALVSAVAPFLEDGQIILLSPGRTGGALEVGRILGTRRPDLRLHVAEAQSLVYACREEAPAKVNVIATKRSVPVAAFPAKDTNRVLQRVSALYPSFCAAPNVMVTSLENIGAVLHPPIVLFNAAAIERRQSFNFYRDMTPQVANLLLTIDAERLRIGSAYGYSLVPLRDWIVRAYPDTPGNTLHDRMRANPAYDQIVAPQRLDSRFLLEDVPTGLVPMVQFARAAEVNVPVIRAIVDLASALLRRNFWRLGRSLESMGVSGMDTQQLLHYVVSGQRLEEAVSR